MSSPVGAERLLLCCLFLCFSPVLGAAQAKTHHNRWEISYQQFKSPDCVRELAVTTNGPTPCSTIRAAQGDTVTYSLLTENAAVHWHGIRQPWAHGTEGVVTYRFVVVDQPGAYTRHAHHRVQRSAGLNLNSMTVMAVPAGQAEQFAYGREHTDVHLARDDTQRAAGRDNGMTAVLVPGRAEAETLACDRDYSLVPLDEWWHVQAAAGNAAVPSVLVVEPQSLSYIVRASFNCSMLASRIRDATSPDCSSPAPFTVAAGKTYHIVTSSGLLFDRAVQLSTASLIALTVIVQVGLYQRKKNGGGGDATALALALLIVLAIGALPNPAVAAPPGSGGGVHDQTAAGPVTPESKAASNCTHDPNTPAHHHCVHH